MKYKRIMAGVFALALTLPLLLSTAHAHPGRTDANGGHTDHDTGEYHYHHGYEAHDHYDMDGDGIVDCPFDFDDKTGQNSGTSSGGSSSGSWSPGSSWSDYSSDSSATHETFSRLELMLGESSEPTEPPQEVSQLDPSAWDLLCQFVGGEETARLIVIDLIVCLVFIPLSIFSSRRNIAKLSHISMPIAFIASIPPVLFLLYIFCELWIVVSFCILIWHIASSLWSWGKQLLSPKRQPEVIVISPTTALGEACTKPVEPPPVQPKPPEPEPEQPQPLPYPKPVPNPVPPQPGPDIPDDGFNTPDPEINFRPNPGLESEVSVHARCHDTCCYLWYETLLIRSCVSPPLSSNSTIYIWTALFYTAVKTLRSQDSVNRIYSYFSEVTGRFVTEIQYRDLVVEKVREVYRSIRPLLNASDIDPRTDNGRRDLWLLIARLIPEGNDPQLQAEFEAAAGRIWQTIADVFPQAHPYPKAGDIRYSIDDLPEA